MNFFVILWSIISFIFRFMFRMATIFYAIVGFFSVLLVIFLVWVTVSFFSDIDLEGDDLEVFSRLGVFDDYVGRFSGDVLPDEFILSLSLDEIMYGLEGEIKNIPMRVALPDYLLKASADDRVKGLELKLGFGGLGLGEVEFLFRSLRGFRTSGKPVYVYGNNFSMVDFPLSQLGDKIWLSPSGSVATLGYGFESPYLADFFGSLGMKAFVFRRGDYKTAPDFLSRSGASDEEIEQRMALLEDWYEGSRDLALSSGRLESSSEFDEIVDGGLYHPELALQKGLVDRLGHYREFRDEILSIWSEGSEGSEESENAENAEEIFVDIREYIYNYEDEFSVLEEGVKTIAYINLSGLIYDAPDDSFFYSGDGINALDWERRLYDLSEDDEIDGVVLRVSSSGGESGASDRLGEALYHLREKKRLFTVIDDVAASGGYYLASSGEKIFIEKSAVTGSIGVFSLLLVRERLNRGLGINWDRFGKGRFSNIFSPNRAPSREETELVQSYIDWSYERFVSHVARGRGMEVSEVESLAQGRVWSGKAALENGLADEQGGVFEAVDMIREELGVADTDVINFVILPQEERIRDFLRIFGSGYEVFWSFVEMMVGFMRSLGLGVQGSPSLMTRSPLFYGG